MMFEEAIVVYNDGGWNVLKCIVCTYYLRNKYTAIGSVCGCCPPHIA